MVVGILQVELLIHGAGSLKDKRSVVQRVKDRLHREHQVSVAEVALQDKMTVAVLGIATVATDARRACQVLDTIVGKLRKLTDAELGECVRQIVRGESDPDRSEGVEPLDAEAIAREMLERAGAGGEA